MRLAFAGTAEFARRVLARLLEAPHDVVMVLTRPDPLAGRGLRVMPSPVKRLALERGLEVFQPASLKAEDVETRVRAARPDALVVVAYGLLVPLPLLTLPPYGAVNVHASLLPRWRGAAPIQRALLAGDRCTGISIMKMDPGLDTGPVFEQRRIDITGDDDTGALHDKLAALGGDTLVDVLEQLHAGRARAVPQAQDGATYAAKIAKWETQLDWQRPAVELERAVRAFRPAPGAATRLDGETIKVWRASIAEGEGPPGTVLDAPSLTIACGKDALSIFELQRAGGRRVSAAEFLHGRPLAPGMRFQ